MHDVRQGDCILAINGENVAGCSVSRVQRLLDDAGETAELLLLNRDTRTSHKLHTLQDFLAPSVADDEALQAIKADVSRGLASRIVPVTSRPPRVDEREGIDYCFVSHQRFEEMVQQNLFLEWGERDGRFELEGSKGERPVLARVRLCRNPTGSHALLCHLLFFQAITTARASKMQRARAICCGALRWPSATASKNCRGPVW